MEERAARMRWSNVPIPEAYVIALAAGLALHRLASMRVFRGERMARVAGLPLLGAGVMLAGWAVAAMGAVDSEAPARLVVTGPYAHSRHPMYVAWALLHAGIGLTLNSTAVLATLPAALLYLHRVEIPGEERRLAAAFGDAYRRYRVRVRRYV